MNEGQKNHQKVIPLQQTILWQNLQNDLKETTFFLSENSHETSSETPHYQTTDIASKNHSTTSLEEINYQMLIIKKSTILGPYFYLPYGPYLGQKDSAKKAYEALQSLAKREHVIFTRIEPQNADAASYWLRNAKKTKDLSPKETWVLDLSPTEEEIFSGMKQNTRNLAKNYSKKGITVEKAAKTPENAQILYHFLREVAKSHHFSPIEEATFQAELNQPFSSLFIAYYTPDSPQPNSPTSQQENQHENQNAGTPQKNSSKTPIAASLFFDGPETRYYMQSGTAQNFRHLPGTLAILSEAIKDAKAKNLKFFDFWGIAPENADKNHPWHGFTKFKKSFGGREVDYAGTYDLIEKPLKYRLYSLLRKLNRLKRKFFK